MYRNHRIIPAMFHRSGFANSNNRFTSVDFNLTFGDFCDCSTDVEFGSLLTGAEDDLLLLLRTLRKQKASSLVRPIVLLWNMLKYLVCLALISVLRHILLEQTVQLLWRNDGPTALANDGNPGKNLDRRQPLCNTLTNIMYCHDFHTSGARTQRCISCESTKSTDEQNDCRYYAAGCKCFGFECTREDRRERRPIRQLSHAHIRTTTICYQLSNTRGCG